MDLLQIKLYVLFKSLVLIHSIGLVCSVYLWLYEVFHCDADFLYEGRCWGYSLGPDKQSVLYIKL